jgi:hypothetical protein
LEGRPVALRPTLSVWFAFVGRPPEGTITISGPNSSSALHLTPCFSLIFPQYY